MKYTKRQEQIKVRRIVEEKETEKNIRLLTAGLIDKK